MQAVISAVAERKLLWLLVLVPILLVGAPMLHERQSLLFVLSVMAIIPLAALLSLATEQVAARTGDAIGGLLNATLGNLTELIIGLTALRAGEYLLVKASLAGAIVTNTLFMTGACFLLGGLKYHVQDFNNASTQAADGPAVPCRLRTSGALRPRRHAIHRHCRGSLSVVIAIILLVTYGFSLVFTLGTHKKYFSSAAHEESA